MQDKSHRERLGRLPQQQYELLQQLETTIQVAFVDTALVKGTVYQISRRCGTPHCRCTRGPAPSQYGFDLE
jgi:hypothetical protein